MKEYNIKEVAQSVIQTMAFFELNVEYIENLLTEAYTEGKEDGKIELLKEQIATAEFKEGMGK